MVLLLVGGVAVGGYVGMTVFDSVHEDQTQIEADLRIHNPNQFSVESSVPPGLMTVCYRQLHSLRLSRLLSSVASASDRSVFFPQ